MIHHLLVSCRKMGQFCLQNLLIPHAEQDSFSLFSSGISNSDFCLSFCNRYFVILFFCHCLLYYQLSKNYWYAHKWNFSSRIQLLIPLFSSLNNSFCLSSYFLIGISSFFFCHTYFNDLKFALFLFVFKRGDINVTCLFY